ncbi:hypothetical protein H6P81_006448 [Aristolochia fimbriata]|uniref:Uncharacterized protein n=1 Tax=Aristolochia fimbriata TaxID=158543 RepID=A0AAV7EYI0_ARIFI|nr:hypothetical protein H6P81_006448 [Aristolochia fimbriata]
MGDLRTSVITLTALAVLVEFAMAANITVGGPSGAWDQRDSLTGTRLPLSAVETEQCDHIDYSAAGDEASTDNITTSTAAATAEEEWEMGDRFLIDDAQCGGDGTGQPIQNDGSETPISAVFSGCDEASTDDATSTAALPYNLLAAAEEEEKWEMEDRFLIDDAL